MKALDILIVEPFFIGSHRAWAEGLKSTSRHNVELLTLPGQFWKWRMRGGALTLARRFNEGLNDGTLRSPDLILATDMLDLSTFLALTRERTSGVSAIPVALYFHENQLTYPWSPRDRDVKRGRDKHYGFINLASALSADWVYFNSRYHMDSFLSALGPFLESFPDENEGGAIEIVRKKSRVLPYGADLKGLDEAIGAADVEGAKPGNKKAPPLILWNHRWEYDKNPEEFFKALYALADEGLDFEVALLGGDGPSDEVPSSPSARVFEEGIERLGKRVVHAGYVEDRASYARWLRRADILPVTSIHDFFGASVVEAIYMGCMPILPRRLAYPEHIPPELHERCFYDDFSGLIQRLKRAIEDIDEIRGVTLKEHVSRYDWTELAPLYDKEFEALKAL